MTDVLVNFAGWTCNTPGIGTVDRSASGFMGMSVVTLLVMLCVFLALANRAKTKAQRKSYIVLGSWVIGLVIVGLICIYVYQFNKTFWC